MNKGHYNQEEITYRQFYIRSKLRQLMRVEGDAGISIKVALLTGLREDEILYCFNQEICEHPLCDCTKLHLASKSNGITIVFVNWIRKGKRCYFILLPTGLWTRFRGLVYYGASDIGASQEILKTMNLTFLKLRRLNHDILSSSMNMNEMDVLIGRVDRIEAQYLLEDIDALIAKYVRAWQRFGLILPVI
jgi:hypothetical protein